MDKFEIRRLNLLALLHSRCNDSAAVLADKIDRSASYVSRMLYPEGKASKKRIGEDMAEIIEKAFNLVKGSMSEPELDAKLPDPAPSSPIPYIGHATRVTIDGVPEGMVAIKRVTLSLRAGVMGFDTVQDFEDGGTVNIPLSFIEENDLVAQCLLSISIKGDSMWPLLIDGDVVVVNIADTKPISGEIYALNFDGEAVVKQMVYEGGEWYLTSFNKESQYHRRICRGGECIIVGRVVRQEARKLMRRV
jgi:phage repressor protein C with HTH and peptisase S24 domain